MAVPVARAATEPELAILATDELLLLQLPALLVLLKVVLAPTHKLCAPLIVPALGKGNTVIIAVSNTVPQLLETL